MLRWRLDGDARHQTQHEITHRALFPNQIRLGAATSGEELPKMERNAQEELKAHLMDTHEEYRRLANQHSDYAKKLDALESLPHLTDAEQLEETRLKKLKLRLKDQMEAILKQYRSQRVA
jgi:uncharacterized protein YdcH (DUF465 family)